jgi:hypothetical protein
MEHPMITAERFRRLRIVAALLAALAAPLFSADTPTTLPAADTSVLNVTVKVDAAQVLRTMQPRRLGGTNVAVWNDKIHFSSPLLHKWISELRPGYIRLPGGSWSQAHYWNGNGVRGPDGKVDPEKVGPDGYPAVDYSDYKPGFNASPKTLKPSTGYHGNVDVKTIHDWIRSLPDVEPMPCLNAGTGRPIDAAEWVKWSNKKMGYNARIWEIGNELGGSWEPGNFLPDGTAITAEMYTARYNAIGAAAKEQDPTIRLGGCAFVREMLRDCGKLVDFASIHTYPGTTAVSPQENLLAVPGVVEREVGRVRGWIREFQPDRENQIELAYTEWNLAGGLNASDLFSGLWHAMFLAEMARNGVHFATQWDIFTHSRGMKSGHALIWSDNDRFVRKAGYYAMMLWNNYMLERVVAASSDQPRSIYTFASASDDAVVLMLVNMTADREAAATIDLAGFSPAPRGEQAVLSVREYHWDDRQHVPLWSNSPRITPIETGPKFTVSLAPFSLNIVRIPSANKPALSALATAATPVVAPKDKPELRLIIPDEIYVGDRVPVLVQASLPGTDQPYPVAVAPAKLSATGAVTFDRPTARLDEALGRFTLLATQPGPFTLAADSDGIAVTRTITAKPSIPRPVLFWDFSEPTLADYKLFESEFTLVADATLRANREVARIDLPPEGIIPSEKDRKRTLFRINTLPPADKLNRANIRGVFFDMMTRDFDCEDPNASVQVVMQSPANYWMVFGSVPLRDATKWQTYQVDATNEKHHQALPASYNLWFVLSSSKPVKGSIYFDKIGFMVR